MSQYYYEFANEKALMGWLRCINGYARIYERGDGIRVGGKDYTKEDVDAAVRRREEFENQPPIQCILAELRTIGMMLDNYYKRSEVDYMLRAVGAYENIELGEFFLNYMPPSIIRHKLQSCVLSLRYREEHPDEPWMGPFEGETSPSEIAKHVDLSYLTQAAMPPPPSLKPRKHGRER